MKCNDSQWNDIASRFNRGQNINEIALKLKLSRSKVRKILITLGLVKSPLSQEILDKKHLGMSLEDLSKEFCIPISTLSTYLPYELDKEKSDNARRIDDFRDRNHLAKERCVKRSSDDLLYESSDMSERIFLKKEGKSSPFKKYPGEITYREYSADEKDKFKNIEFGVYRLHLELMGTDEDTIRVLKESGGVRYGNTISRDIIIPGTLMLWNLHYLIQRAFGWQNSHLHRFYLSDDDLIRITDGKAGNWANLTGTLFRSPFMIYESQFWADNYEDTQSFKTWLRKKYKGMNYSKCAEESFWKVTRDMAPYQDPLLYSDTIHSAYLHTGDYKSEYNSDYVLESQKIWDGSYLINSCYPVNDPPLNEWEYDTREVMKFKDLPVKAMSSLYEGYDFELLERCFVMDILTPHDKGINDGPSSIDFKCESYEEAMQFISLCVRTMGTNLDIPENQPYAPKVADALYYQYDFGDSWEIKITASEGAYDLIESGRVTDEEISEAARLCWNTGCPVMIARDGMDLCDDMGGFYGLGNFINAITENGGEVGPYEYGKSDAIKWAKSLGWSNRNIALKKRL